MLVILTNFFSFLSSFSWNGVTFFLLYAISLTSWWVFIVYHNTMMVITSYYKFINHKWVINWVRMRTWELLVLHKKKTVDTFCVNLCTRFFFVVYYAMPLCSHFKAIFFFKFISKFLPLLIIINCAIMFNEFRFFVFNSSS